MTVAERELVVLIGPNGAGKSTLLKSIAGFLKPREGAIAFEGKPIGGLKPARDHAAGHRLRAAGGERVSLAQRRGEPRNRRLRRPPRDQRAHRRRTSPAFPILAERRAQEARTLSGGQRQILAVAMALMAAPRLMLLDEPSAGLSPAASAELFDADQGACTTKA